MGISSKYQKDYSNVNFENPRLLKKREKHKLFWLRSTVVIGVCLFVSGVVFVFYSGFFRINEYDVSGLNKIKKENIDTIINNYLDKRRLFIFSHRNYWLVDKNELKAEISKYYYFEKLEIKRKLPNHLMVDVSEKQPMINWVSKELCFHVDLTGAAIGYCENDSGLLTIRDLQARDVNIGALVVGPKALAYIVELHQKATNLLRERYKPLYYELNGNVLEAKSDTGPAVRYNMDLDVGEQVGRLDLISQQKDVRDIYPTLKYIDLRFGEKVFYQ